jgi:preprotein translocase subunit SecE
VARQTRDERRKRRAQSDASADRAQRTSREAVRPVAEPAVHAPEPRKTHFLAESWGELRKVEWPRQQQVVQGTIVVLIACLVVGFYLWGADQVFKRLVEQVLLR